MCSLDSSVVDEVFTIADGIEPRYIVTENVNNIVGNL
jgi:hypothetical protein